ncbi:growth inhibitor PemK [Maricaulis sp.]|uniref:growth inhibitor PemK n=2 Tax=Maricaulis sp. TaxID=1486257 RepID=UPI003296E52C|tara:strand:+ start:372 stop:809 length:438 start_codon:yes stop_codon:yes gene_type:complete
MAFPEPETGRVIGYNFLWSHERDAGESAGRKARPVLILAVREITAGREVWVVPFTGQDHAETPHAVAVPPRVQAHLGLTRDASYIIASQINVFVWPGADLNRYPERDGVMDIGFVPPALLRQVQIALRSAWESQAADKTVRDPAS